MTNVYDKAKELGEAIKSSEEMTAYKNAELKQENDEVAQELIKEYNLKRMNLAKKVHEEKLEKEALEAVKAELDAEFQKLMQNEAIAQYVNTKKAFDAMVSNINSLLGYYITGQEKQEDGCSPSKCSSCSSCN